MSDDNYDDGLVHRHSWSHAGATEARGAYPIADTSSLRTPSTAAHDDLMFGND